MNNNPIMDLFGNSTNTKGQPIRTYNNIINTEEAKKAIHFASIDAMVDLPFEHLSKMYKVVYGLGGLVFIDLTHNLPIINNTELLTGIEVSQTLIRQLTTTFNRLSKTVDYQTKLFTLGSRDYSIMKKGDTISIWDDKARKEIKQNRQ